MRSRSSETEDGAAGAPPKEQTSTSGADSRDEETGDGCSVSDLVSPRGTSQRRCTSVGLLTPGWVTRGRSLHVASSRVLRGLIYVTKSGTFYL